MKRGVIITLIILVTAGATGCRKTVTDIDGNQYRTVKIGGEIWMAENLRTTRYNDGEPIPNITSAGEWVSLTEGAYCWYDNDKEQWSGYGALYNWYAVETGKLCPDGWRVPSAEEWSGLIESMGGIYEAGAQMKSRSTEPDPHPRWDIPNEGAADRFRFEALPGGWRVLTGGFHSVGNGAFWWSSTETDSAEARYVAAGSAGERVMHTREMKIYGMSIRCIKEGR